MVLEKDVQVILIDDEVKILESLRRLLEFEGIPVHVTTDQAEVLSLIENEQIR